MQVNDFQRWVCFACSTSASPMLPMEACGGSNVAFNLCRIFLNHVGFMAWEKRFDIMSVIFLNPGQCQHSLLICYRHIEFWKISLHLNFVASFALVYLIDLYQYIVTNICQLSLFLSRINFCTQSTMSFNSRWYIIYQMVSYYCAFVSFSHFLQHCLVVFLDVWYIRSFVISNCLFSGTRWNWIMCIWLRLWITVDPKDVIFSWKQCIILVVITFCMSQCVCRKHFDLLRKSDQLLRDLKHLDSQRWYFLLDF